MDKKWNHRDVNYLPENTPMRGTSFEYMMTGVYYGDTESRSCLAGPVQDVEQAFDTMLSSKNCKNVHRYLTEDKFDVEGLEQLLLAQFGEEEIA